MAKNITKPAASSFFNVPAEAQPEAQATVTPQPPTDYKSDDVAAPISASSVAAPGAGTNETTFSMNLPKKAKRTKLTSLKVNADEYDEFSKIAREMGYTSSAVINQFISDFVKANKSN